MSYGLKVHNDSGFEQIDGTYSNYALVASGVAQAFSWVSYSLAQPPLIFARPVTIPGDVFGKIDHPQRRFTLHSTNSTSIQYRIYAPANIVSNPGGWGFRVWNSGGALVFNSGHNYPRVVSVAYRDVETQGPINIPYPAGMTPWAFVNSSIPWSDAGGGLSLQPAYEFGADSRGYVRVQQAVDGSFSPNMILKGQRVFIISR